MENDKMKVKVYIDVLWMETFFLYVMFLQLTHLTLRRREEGAQGPKRETVLSTTQNMRKYMIEKLRLIFGAMLGATLEIAQIFILRKNLMIDIFTAIITYGIMLGVAWKHPMKGMKKLKSFMKEGCCFTCFLFIFGGAFKFVISNIRNYVDEKKTGYLTVDMMIVSILLCLAMIGGIYMIRRRGTLSCIVELYYDQYMIRVNALVDTGNSLFEPISKRPVSIVEKEVFQEIASSIKVEKASVCCIPYHAIGKEGILWGIHIPMMKIIRDQEEIIRENVIVAFYDGHLSGKKEYQMLLHPDMLIM